MTDASTIEWCQLIDEVLLAEIREYGEVEPDVDTVYLTGSYVRGTYNPSRPNVNVYVIATPGRADQVRLGLGRLFAEVRSVLRKAGVEFVVDCHPYTVSQRDREWVDRPLLTLTSKVLEGEAADSRYRIAPTIGLGWAVSHRVLVGRPDALNVFAQPPRRDRAWLSGAHAALSHYRNILDHLPWALDWLSAPRLLIEESCRYAEEALRDGVHIALSEVELESGSNIDILFDWRAVGRSFYQDRYGERGAEACDTVDQLKAMIVGGPFDQATAEFAWFEALSVWSVVWDGYLRTAHDMGAAPELLHVTAWL